MLRYLWVVLVLLLIAVPPMAKAGGSAGVPDGTRISSETVAPLMQWVAAKTGYKMPSQPHVIASRSMFSKIQGNPNAAYAGTRGLYLPGMIVLDNQRWNADDVVEQSYLVHELVHHGQLLGRVKFACAAEREAEAYVIQNAYLEEQGLPPLYTQRWIEKVSSCDTGERIRAASFGHQH